MHIENISQSSTNDSNVYKRKLKLSYKRKERFYGDLGILVNSGLDLKSAFNLLIEERKNENEKQVFKLLYESMEAGNSLAEGMKKTGCFDPYEIYSIQIGEESGRIHIIITNLSEFYERKIEQNKIISGALTYPLLVLATAIIVLIFMFFFIVPMFEDVFTRFGGELPALTGFIINISGWFQEHGLMVLFFIAGLILLLKKLRSNSDYRNLITKIKLAIPFFSSFYKKIYLARFSEALALLSSANIHITSSLTMVNKMIDFSPIQKAIPEVIKDLESGISLKASLKKHSIFDSRMITLIGVAEEVNALENVFTKLSKQYNKELNHSSKQLGTILEPILILFVGGIVATILISMYLPMFKLSTTIY